MLKNRYKNFNISADNLQQYNELLQSGNATDVFVFAQQNGISVDQAKKDMKKYGYKTNN